MSDKPPHAVTYEKALADVKGAFRVIEQNFSFVLPSERVGKQNMFFESVFRISPSVFET